MNEKHSRQIIEALHLIKHYMSQCGDNTAIHGGDDDIIVSIANDKVALYDLNYHEDIIVLKLDK